MDVNGVGIAFHVFGTGTGEGREGDDEANVVLIHGFAAHSHWWDHVVPMLTASCRVLVVDLSGHGDSDHREQYSIEIWAEEVIRAQRLVFGATPVLLVGHSVGGRVAIAAARHSDSTATGVLVVDSSFPGPETSVSHGEWKAVKRTYESREAAIGRFRLIPPQPLDDCVLHSVAKHSVRSAADGWSWKHDHRLNPMDLAVPSPTGIAVPLTIVYGEHSAVVDAAMAARMARAAGPLASVQVVAGAYHHVVLDSPIEVAKIVKASLSRRGGKV